MKVKLKSIEILSFQLISWSFKKKINTAIESMKIEINCNSFYTIDFLKVYIKEKYMESKLETIDINWNPYLR